MNWILIILFSANSGLAVNFDTKSDCEAAKQQIWLEHTNKHPHKMVSMVCVPRYSS